MCDSTVSLYDTNLFALVFSDLLGIGHICPHFCFPVSYDHILFSSKKSFELFIFLYIWGVLLNYYYYYYYFMEIPPTGTGEV